MKLGGLLLLVTLIIVFTNICCASSICNEAQEATLFTTFEVECSLPNLEWISVIYHKEGHELIRYQKAKCEDSSGRTIGPGDKDGTLHITNTGVLVFNNITMNDSTNYQLEYLDCDGGSYDQYKDNFYISVNNVEEPTTAPSESSTTSSQPNTPEEPVTAPPESCTTSSHYAPSEEPTTAPSESCTTSSQPNGSGLETRGKIIISVVCIFAFFIFLLPVVVCMRKKKEAANGFREARGEDY